MGMAFTLGRKRSPFAPPPMYGTPGIGDDLPGAKPMGGMEVPAFLAGSVPPAPARMAFRGVSPARPASGMAEAPAVSTTPLDTPLEDAGQAPPISMMPRLEQPKAGFFDKDGAWRDVLGALADGMAGAVGMQPTYGPNKTRQRHQQAEWERLDAQRRQDRAWAEQDRDAKLAQPQYFMSGRDRVMFDPTTGEAQKVYDGPADFEEYADSLGLEPGSEEYNDAKRDYVLRSNGPTALEGREELENLRQGNRVTLEGVRHGNRAALRQTPTYSNLHPRPAAGGGGSGNGRPPRTTGNVYAPILAKVARGEKLTQGEERVISMYGRGARSGAGGAGSGGGGLPTVRTPAEAAKLPKGTRFRTPDGRIKVVS